MTRIAPLHRGLRARRARRKSSMTAHAESPRGEASQGRSEKHFGSWRTEPSLAEERYAPSRVIRDGRSTVDASPDPPPDEAGELSPPPSDGARASAMAR